MGKYFFLVVIAVLSVVFDLVAQESTKKTTRITVDYIKDANNLENIIAKLIVREDRYLPFANAEILFYNVNDTAKIPLEKVTTDIDGFATYTLDEEQEIYIDSLGFMTFQVEYVGDSDSRPATGEVSVKKSDLNVSFLQEDTIKYITVNANEIRSDNSIIPIEGIDISFFVKGTFSYLKIGEQLSDDHGLARLEFPIYMPGDSAGVLTIAAKIEDSDTYGSVEAMGVMNWGIPVPIPEEKHRGLGDTDAPLWMVYTLIVLLSTVWFHYMYVIFTVIKIKLLRKSVQPS